MGFLCGQCETDRSLVKRTEAASVEAVTEPSISNGLPLTEPTDIVTTVPPELTTSRPARQKVQSPTRKAASFSHIEEFAP